MNATAWIDGGNRGQPGPSACAVVLELENGGTRGEAFFLGVGTNNTAEYGGLILALETAREEGVTHLTVRSDSKLIVEQVLGNWRVREPSLRPLHQQAQDLAREFEEVFIKHIPREENKRADALCTDLLDSITGRKRKT